MRVHVVGNVCIDTSFHLDRFPAPGETLNARSYDEGVGGKGANQAVAAARTGADVDFWAAVGNDAAAAWIRARLEKDLDVSRLTVLSLASDRSTILIDAAGENAIVSGVTCAEAFDPLRDTSFLDYTGTGDIVVLQGNLRSEITAKCLSAARSHGAITILNPSPLSSPAQLDLNTVDIVVANSVETEALTGHTNPERGARGLVERGASAAVVTLGSNGCLVIVGGGEIEHIAALQVPVLDTSGAGDVFCGCLAGCLGQRLSLVQAARVAVAAAALSVGRPGTLDACPATEETISLIRRIEMEKP